METNVPKSKNSKFNWIKVFLKWLGITLCGILIAWLVTTKLNSVRAGDTSSKKIAVIMSGTDKTFTIPKEFEDGFPKIASFPLKSQTIFIEPKEDLYSIEQAKIVADEIVNDDSYVLIIGNSNSELTEVTLNSILASKNRPSFILPIATADNILAKANSENYKSILRMVPDNNNQAEMIKSFIFSKMGENANVGLLIDEENETYSNNLSKNISAKILDYNGHIVLSKKYGKSCRFIDEYETLKKNKLLPDIVVYVGVSSNGLLLIEEFKALHINIPIIFTDGCTVERLMIKSKELKNKAYFLSSVSKSEGDKIEPTYKPIGHDAFDLAQKILSSIDEPITRSSVRNYIEKNKLKIIMNGDAGNYKFNEEGNNQEMKFKIYTYQNGILTEVKGL